jgi:putative flippase GtrA
VNSLRVLLGRWLKFHTVGAMGIVVQLSVLSAFVGWLNIDYLVATALAVEAAILHNFVWHERWTWMDRTRTEAGVALLRKPPALTVTSRASPAFVSSSWLQSSHGLLLRKLAALTVTSRASPAFVSSLWPQSSHGLLVAGRLFRFNLTTGFVSIGSNLVLMRLLVGQVHLHYMFANILTIAACSVANFLLSELFVFRRAQ